MRIKKDDSSWRASGILVRDERWDKSTPEVPKHKGNKKKNTRKWCKGKVGIEHVPHIVEFEYYTAYFIYDVCKNCGKRLKYKGVRAKPRVKYWR